MTIASIEQGVHALRNGKLVILFDDLETQTSALFGISEKVGPEQVNLMTKIAKGLIYVCIDKKTAEHLQLPLMVHNNTNGRSKNFTVSVDYKTATTGISAYERADTIKAMTDTETMPVDFKRPGHIFPIISQENGLLDQVDLFEASIDLAKKLAIIPSTYISEILNDKGEISNRREVEKLASTYHLPFIPISTLLIEQQDKRICKFSGTVIKGRQLGRTIGFPTANLAIPPQNNVPTNRGVYGVKVMYKEKEYVGVMNVGIRPSFEDSCSEVHYEVHVLNFNEFIYGEKLTIEVCFFIRGEKRFQNVGDLISQIHKDSTYVKNRFGLNDKVSVY